MLSSNWNGGMSQVFVNRREGSNRYELRTRVKGDNPALPLYQSIKHTESWHYSIFYTKPKINDLIRTADKDYHVIPCHMAHHRERSPREPKHKKTKESIEVAGGHDKYTPHL